MIMNSFAVFLIQGDIYLRAAIEKQCGGLHNKILTGKRKRKSNFFCLGDERTLI